MARPIKYDVDLLIEQLHEYIDGADDPQLSEFCLGQDKPCREYLWQIAKNSEELSYVIKKLHSKQELYLSRCGNGTLNPSMAIFRLKQPIHGYVDKTEQEVTVNNSIAERLQRARERKMLNVTPEIQMIDN